jgi:hypothetical protein
MFVPIYSAVAFLNPFFLGQAQPNLVENLRAETLVFIIRAEAFDDHPVALT